MVLLRCWIIKSLVLLLKPVASKGFGCGVYKSCCDFQFGHKSIGITRGHRGYGSQRIEYDQEMKTLWAENKKIITFKRLISLLLGAENSYLLKLDLNKTMVQQISYSWPPKFVCDCGIAQKLKPSSSHYGEVD